MPIIYYNKGAELTASQTTAYDLDNGKRSSMLPKIQMRDRPFQCKDI